MAKYKNISGIAVRGPFIPGDYAEPGEVVDLPDEQVVTVDGKEVERLPLIHSSDVWEPVKQSKPAAKAADEGGEVNA